MKKMIGQEKINKSDALFEGMTADANGNVTIGKNLEVDGDVIINTTTDLKTKDGTSFGGGEEFLEITENYNISPQDYTSFKNGEKKCLLFNGSNNKKKFVGVFAGNPIENSIGSRKFIKLEARNYETQGDSFKFYLVENILSMRYYEDGTKSVYDKGQNEVIEYDEDTGRIRFSNDTGSSWTYHDTYSIKKLNTTATPKILQCVNSVISWVDLPTAKQYYNHDVQIMFNNSPLYLSIVTPSNTPIDSITDLKTACGSRKRIPMSGGFPGTGSIIQFACAYLPQENKLQLYSSNTASVGDTTVLLATGEGNTLGTITDDVTTP